MKKIYYSIILVAVLLHSGPLCAQLCDPSTPSFVVDLTGNPMAVWISPSGTRQGQCCSATPPDVCVEFILTLDPAAVGINFNIASGAIPPGALYYQINCGPPVEVGHPICLNGAGPHHLTFCKPGNNQNTYSITSFGDPVVQANVSNTVSPECSAILTAQAANFESITWTSVPPNGIYNSFLSCTTDCDTVTITPSGSFPPYIDYSVCVTGISDCSDPAGVCDTVRVYLYHDVAVSVSPSDIILCNGVTTTTLKAIATGGSGSYQYLWSNGQSTPVINAGAGTYSVTVTDTATCMPASGSANITVRPPIVANAGSDITVCANEPTVSLNGNIQTATAANWNGGSGIFNPNNATLNANYTPSASEIQNGFAVLILETTANQGCPPAYDTIRITIVQPPTPAISGSLIACVSSTTTYSTALLPGCSYNWNVTGGTINGSANSNSITISWGMSGSGTVNLTITNSNGCTASDEETISLVVAPNPVISGMNSPCQFTSGSYAVTPSPGSMYSWFVTNGTIMGSTNSSSIQVNWNSEGSSSISVTETNSFGCITTNTMPVTVNQQPVPVISGNTITCVGNSTVTYTSPFINNSSYAWSVNGGTIVSTNGSNTIDVLWESGGNNSVTLSVFNAAGCDSTILLAVTTEVLAPVTVQANSYSGCPPLTVTFSGNTAVSGQTYAWTFGDQLYSAASNPTHIYKESGTYNLTVITQNGGCTDSATATINVFDVPAADFSHNYEGSAYYIGESSLELTNSTEGGTSYLWTFGTGDTSNVFEPNVKYEEPGTYLIQLVSFNSSNCPDTAEREINVRLSEHIYVPSGFTPNGDNANDYFHMLTVHIKKAEIAILNRWGQTIFESNDVDFKWDGTFHGGQVQLGVYVYKIYAWGDSGRNYTVIGTVTVVR